MASNVSSTSTDPDVFFVEQYLKRVEAQQHSEWFKFDGPVGNAHKKDADTFFSYIFEPEIVIIDAESNEPIIVHTGLGFNN